jgi:hypothetical protein
MAETVMHEFLVGLGWRDDEKSREQFQNAISVVGTAMKGLVATAATTAVAVGVAATNIARDLAGLYYQAKVIGASVKEVDSVRFAFDRLQGSGEEAAQSFQNFVRRFGEESQWRGTMEKAEREEFEAGHHREAWTMIIERLRREAAADPARKAAILSRAQEVFLISRDIIGQPGLLESPAHESVRQLYQKFDKDYGDELERNAKAAARANEQYENLLQALKALMESGAAVFFKDLCKAFDGLAKSIDEHRDGIVAFFDGMLTQIERAGNDIRKGLIPILEYLKQKWKEIADQIEETTGYDVHGVKGLTLALGLLFGYKTLTGIGSLAKALWAIPGPFIKLFAVISAIVALVKMAKGWFGPAAEGPPAPTPQEPAPGGVTPTPETHAIRPDIPVTPPEVSAPTVPQGQATPTPEFHFLDPKAPVRPPESAAMPAAPIPPPPAGDQGGVHPLKQAIDEAAKDSGIDPQIMYGIVGGESGRGEGYDKNLVGECSYGPFQVNICGGVGNDMQKAGIDPTDPSTYRKQAFFIARNLKRDPHYLNYFHGFFTPRGGRQPWGRHWGSMGIHRAPPAPASGGSVMFKNPLGAVKPGARNPVSMLDPNLMGGLRGRFNDPRLSYGTPFQKVTDNRNITSETNIHIAGTDQHNPTLSHPKDASLAPRYQLAHMQGATA